MVQITGKRSSSVKKTYLICAKTRGSICCYRKVCKKVEGFSAKSDRFCVKQIAIVAKRFVTGQAQSLLFILGAFHNDCHLQFSHSSVKI